MKRSIINIIIQNIFNVFGILFNRKSQIAILMMLPLLLSGGLFAQIQCYKHEFSVYGGGGLSSLMYKPTFGDQSLRLGGHFGLGYHFFFSPNWGLGTGLELGFYRSKFNMNNLNLHFMATDWQNKNFEFRSTVNDFEEKQRAMLLQIPLMLQFQTNREESNRQFFAALGGKAGIPLRGRYNNVGTFNNAGYFAYENALYDTQRFMGFGEFPNRESNGNLDFKTAFFLSAEAGVKWRLNDRFSLYTGVYFDFGLNNILKTQNAQFVNYSNEAIPAVFSANSILKSQYTQQGSVTSQAFTDKVRPIALGIKVRLAFGKDCRQRPLPPAVTDDCDDLRRRLEETLRALDDALKALEDCQDALKDCQDALEDCQNALKDCQEELEKQPEPELDHVTILRGRVLDDDTKNPIGATIEIIDNNTHEVVQVVTSDPQTGDYKIILPSGRNYGITVSAPDYLFHSDNFNIPDASGQQEIQNDVLLHKLEVGKTIVLKNIFFDFDRATLQQTSFPELANVIRLMTEYPTLVIEISGHTDNRGAAAYNQVLSENRARTVVNYLVANGIPASRLRYAGYGLTRPIADNNTDEGRALNRRVEFKILEM